MSVHTSPSTDQKQTVDTSTQHAGYGTIVIVLILVIAAVIIGQTLYSHNTATQSPVVVSQAHTSNP